MFTRLILAIMLVESGGDSAAHGDRDKWGAWQSHGSLQIKQCVIDDVNRWTGQSLTVDDVHDDTIARECFVLYMLHYATQKRLGRRVTDQDRYRIWNGGPDGWREYETIKNWKKVREHL